MSYLRICISFQLINDSQRYSGYILDLGKLWVSYFNIYQTIFCVKLQKSFSLSLLFTYCERRYFRASRPL